jgi:autotransporter-associated beta strand protein
VVHISYSATGADVASLTVDSGSTVGTYQNGFRFVNLDSSVSLPAGDYTVWVEYMGGGVDKFAQNISTYDNGSGAITPYLTVYQTNLYAMPDQNWGVNSEASATFMYYNPSGIITANLLPITTPVLMGGAAGSTPTLDLQGASQQIASLADVAGATVFGVVKNSAASTPVVLTLSAASGTTTYSGSIDGNLSLVKDGGSIQNLTGSLTYTGNTTVNAGTLNVSSIDTPAATVYVATGATLTATSIVADTLSIGGTPLEASVAAAVPEPGTLVLLVLAGLTLAGAYLRRK